MEAQLAAKTRGGSDLRPDEMMRRIAAPPRKGPRR